MNLNKTYLLIIILIALFSNFCDKDVVDVESLVDYDEYFDTQGVIEINEIHYPLNYGGIELVNTDKNSKEYEFILYDVDLENKLFEGEKDLLLYTPYISISMNIISPQSKDLSEGIYIFNINGDNSPFFFNNPEFNISQDSQSINQIESYNIIDGKINIESVNDYPFPGYASIMIKLHFELILEYNDTIRGNFIGRVLN